MGWELVGRTLDWIRSVLCAGCAGQDRTPPKGTRFSAHGGELGAPWQAASS